MESNKGVGKWIIGVGVLVLIIYAILVMSSQTKNDIKISKSDLKEEILKFDRDFYETQSKITLSDELKESLETKEKLAEDELLKIKIEKEEQLKRQKELEEKEKRVFDVIEKEFNKQEKDDMFFKF